MGLLQIVAVISALAGVTLSSPTNVATPSAQYCDPDTTVCYSSSTVGVASISYRLAIPNVTASPFDLILQIVAPKAAQWAGIAFGGHMINNTIAMAWANGNTSVVSSRWAAAHEIPEAYEGAEYTLLEGSVTNDTHWTMTALCKGCSTWIHDGGSVTSMDPNSPSINLAWAASPYPVGDPADNYTMMSIHSEHGTFSLDLAAAKTDDFDSFVQSLTPAPINGRSA
ncbi:iron reductase domain protein [Xylariaceae sp. FL1272]|nr:iron reductase domain protein [Xylariaceae sp. FL1272]